MDQAVYDRLFGYQHAFDHPVTTGIVISVGALVAVTPILIFVLAKLGKIDVRQQKELNQRTLTWALLIPLMIGPILLGAAWTIAAVGVLSVLCYREYARATGLFREKTISLTVLLGIIAVTFAVMDHWYGFFVALGPLFVVVICAVAILADRPKGYVQRVALGIFGFLMFGLGLGHLGYMANDALYRPMLIMLLLCVELNDVFAYICGKTFGKRKLCINTSPNKTLGGALGALVLTTSLVAIIGHYLFKNTVVDQPLILIGLGLLVSIGGQLGDLMLSSIKRDIGVKDIGQTLPGHGGLLDRFDSILLVAPGVFHYLGYFRGIGLDQATRIITIGSGGT